MAMNARRLDYRMYLITDCRLDFDDVLRIAGLALENGATILQYRHKQAATATMYAEASELRRLTRRCSRPLIINDRIDLALAVSADGVHLGQEDMPVPVARALLGANAVIGVTVHDYDQALLAHTHGADYIAVSGSGASAYKPVPAMAVAEQERIIQGIPLPCLAIGGIDAENAAPFLRKGYAGVALISAVFQAADPGRVCRHLHKNIS